MEQVAKATCILCKKLQRTRGGTWRFPRVSRAKSGILWLSGGTTRVKWRGASYLGPSRERFFPIYDLGASLAPRAAAHLLKKRKGPVGATGLTPTRSGVGAPPHSAPLLRRWRGGFLLIAGVQGAARKRCAGEFSVRLTGSHGLGYWVCMGCTLPTKSRTHELHPGPLRMWVSPRFCASPDGYAG